MLILLAFAQAESTFEVQLPDCRRWSTGVRCQQGAFELTVRVNPVREGSTERSARVGRFLQLLDWPQCSFQPAWLDGERGWQASCTNGERAWVGRWWVVEQTIYSQSLAGPADRIEQTAVAWFSKVGFRGRVVTAPAP